MLGLCESVAVIVAVDEGVENCDEVAVGVNPVVTLWDGVRVNVDSWLRVVVRVLVRVGVREATCVVLGVALWVELADCEEDSLAERDDERDGVADAPIEWDWVGVGNCERVRICVVDGAGVARCDELLRFSGLEGVTLGVAEALHVTD